MPHADGRLVATPDVPDTVLLPSLLTLSDAMGTGWCAAAAAGALSARQLGAERIIALSRHAPRQRLATQFGATDVLPERGSRT